MTSARPSWQMSMSMSGYSRAVGIGEALEEQAVPHRARVGEAQHVADHRAHARAAGVGGDAALPRPVHEVPDDQEVRADELVGEDLQLAIEPGANRLGDAVGAVAPDETGFAQIAQRPVAFRSDLFGAALRLELRVVGNQLEAGAVRLEPRRRVAALVAGRLAGMLDPDHRRVAGVEVELDVAALARSARCSRSLPADRRTGRPSPPAI